MRKRNLTLPDANVRNANLLLQASFDIYLRGSRTWLVPLQA